MTRKVIPRQQLENILTEFEVGPRQTELLDVRDIEWNRGLTAELSKIKIKMVMTKKFGW